MKGFIPTRSTRFRRGQRVTWDLGAGIGQVVEIFPSKCMQVEGKDKNGQKIARLYDRDGVLCERSYNNNDLTLDDPDEADLMDMI